MTSSTTATTPPASRTSVHVSTITATAHLGYPIDLDSVFPSIRIDRDDDTTCSIQIVYAEYKDKVRGYIPPKPRSSKKNASIEVQRRCSLFDHQMTLVASVPRTGSRVNAKVFVNGHVQMTGLKTIDTGQEVMDELRELIHRKPDASTILINPSSSSSSDIDVIETKYDETLKVHLINCDFKIGYMVDRKRLFEKLTTCYDVYALYEPCIYPGVRIQFFFNPIFKAQNAIGVCMCNSKCSYCRTSHSVLHKCCKSTIMVFQSGSIIISGSRSMDQVHAAHKFISSLLDRHREEFDPNFATESRPNVAQVGRS